MADKYPGRTVTRDGDSVVVRVSVQFYRRNGSQQVIGIADDKGQQNPANRSDTLIAAIAKAWQWQEQLESGEYRSIEDLAAANKIDASYMRRMLRLTSLAPDLVEAIMENRGPDDLSLARLHRGIPLIWVGRGI